MAGLEAYETLLRDKMARQNLIAASTVDTLWARHFADSAQLLHHADDVTGPWLDIGSGAGLPGLVVAIIDPARPVHLVESRALRCDFLRHVVQELGLANVTVHHSPLERVPSFEASVISARAFAPLGKLFALSERFAGQKTRWLLPKGRNAVNELESVSKAWQGLFHVEQSLTDGESHILIGTGRA